MLALSLAVLVIGWCVLWLVARHEARQSLDAWIAAEREEGRIWTCPDRRVGGFPLGIVLRCSKPTFEEAGNTAFHGELAGLRAQAELHFPTSVTITLDGPMTIRDQGVYAGLTVSWGSAHIQLRGDLPGALDRGQLEAEGVDITANGLATPIRIGHGELAFKPEPQKAPGPSDAELTLIATGISTADADAAFGSNDTMTVKVVATLGRLPSRGASLPTLLEAWRAAGGQLDLARFEVSKGAFRAEGTGRLRIDDDHRIEGRLDARFAGLEPIAARFGIPVGAVKIGGLLSNLLGGKRDKAQPVEAGLTVPLVARAGQLYLGPVKTGLALSPLY